MRTKTLFAICLNSILKKRSFSILLTIFLITKLISTENTGYSAISIEKILSSQRASLAAEELKLVDQMNEIYGDIPKGWFSCSVDVKKIKYYICTPSENQNCSTVMIGNQTELEKSPLVLSNDLKIFIHGWLLNESGINYIERLNTEYSSWKNLSIVIVDWGDYSKCEYLYTINYVVPYVGKSIGMFIEDLKNYGVSTENIHMVGFSLGAHIASNTVKSLDYKIKRITGLDPAGPGYEGYFHSDRLDKEDANFVDIIHTNTFLCGIKKPIGHADFYPNGGKFQNGCNYLNMQCHHKRSVFYFLESINTELGFYGMPCKTYDDYEKNNCTMNQEEMVMGEYIDYGSSGEYFLDTNKDTPYSKGRQKI